MTLVPESSVREHLEVRARPNIVDLADTSTTSRISSEFIDSLPLLGRNYQDVLTLAPGVSDIDGDGNPTVHGARDTDLMTQVDGVNTTDPLTGKSGAKLNIESIQEIEFKTSGAGAEYGRAQGAFANILTKSGGNEFEGTFKMFWRGSALDGDGAGIDDPGLHFGIGEKGLRDLRFNDYLPFVSLGGPIRRDHAWFFVTSEYIQKEEPVNALNTAFVRGLQEYRQFLKLTWQVTVNQRLALSLNYDPQEYLNDGLNSFTRTETGYTTRAGGTLLTLRDTAVLGAAVSLETTLSSFDGRPALVPNLDRDTNGNGRLFYDRNDNHFMEASERDPGEDYDGDGRFDVFEDLNHNGVLDPGEDRDGDRRLTPDFGCEGLSREDRDCDGHLDTVDEDTNHNGMLDWLYFPPFVLEDADHDGRFDRGVEDGNASGKLDDTPRPTGLYPYGRLTPQPRDADYNVEQTTGIISGPYYKELSDRRRRLALRQDLSVYVDGPRGTHDLKIGWIAEREEFARTTHTGEIMTEPCLDPFHCGITGAPTVKVLLPTAPGVDNEATGMSTGLYVQDSFKPVPNLNFGIGVRFDRELTDSFGYSFFDPATERAPFDRVSALGGAEIGRNDFQQGNNDGLSNFGVRGDPLFAGDPQSVSYLTDPLRAIAIGRLTRHHSAANFESAKLSALFPDIFVGDQIDVQRLRDLGVAAQTREEFTITNNNFSPRLSLSWDPWKDGRTKVFSTWGRYYDRLFLSTIVGEEGPDYLARYYTVDPDGLNVNYISTFAYGSFRRMPVSAAPNDHIGDIISSAAPSTTQVDRGLRTPFSDELTFGFQREIAPEVALTVTYINRRYRDQLQDIDVNHTLRFDPLTGQPVDQLGFLVTSPSGGYLKVPDSRPDLYILNPFFNQVLRIGNYNEAYYRGIEVQVVRRLARRWQMQGSYTYSRAFGAAEDFQSRLGNDPSTREPEIGYLDYDQRHVVKFFATGYLPHDWQVGSSMTWASGLPYSIISRFFALDNEDYQQYRTRFGYTLDPALGGTFKDVRRNSQRNDATLDINVSLRKTFVVGRTTAAASVEIFNLLNSDDLRIFTVEPNKNQSPAPPADPMELRVVGVDSFLPIPLQLDAERRFGRRIQIGIQFQY